MCLKQILQRNKGVGSLNDQGGINICHCLFTFLILATFFGHAAADTRGGSLTHAFLLSPSEVDFSELPEGPIYNEVRPLPVVETDFIFESTYNSVSAPFGMIRIETPDPVANVLEKGTPEVYSIRGRLLYRGPENKIEKISKRLGVRALKTKGSQPVLYILK